MIWLCSQPDPEHGYWREEGENGLRDQWGSPDQQDLPGQPQDGGHRNTGGRQPAPSRSAQHCWRLEVRWGVGTAWGRGPAPEAPRLTCRAARRILVPDQGSILCPLRWQVDTQPLGHHESPRPFFFKYQHQVFCLGALSLLVRIVLILSAAKYVNVGMYNGLIIPQEVS